MSKKENGEFYKKISQRLLNIVVVPSKKIAGMALGVLSLLTSISKAKISGEEESKKGRVKTIEHNHITWVDIESPSAREVNKLAEEYKFHPLHLETALAKGQLPHVEREEKYIFIVLPIPEIDRNENRILTNQLSIFLGKNYIVTMHDEIPFVKSQFKLIENDMEVRDAFFKRSAGYLLYMLLGNLLKEIEALTQTISYELDEVEDLVFDVTASGVHKISKLRQKIIRMRRILAAFKKIFEGFNPEVSDFTGDNLTRYYNNLARVVDTLRETLSEAVETVDVYKDVDNIVSNEKTNQILTVLTIIFTFSLPATVVGAVYGMNVILPGGVESQVWNFWGPYTTFIVLLIVMLIPVSLMLLFFKIKKWF